MSGMFAPHTRGSTFVVSDRIAAIVVCPAHAGVYPLVPTNAVVHGSLPRTRGGLPR